jgi:hypothetical protein
MSVFTSVFQNGSIYKQKDFFSCKVCLDVSTFMFQYPHFLSLESLVLIRDLHRIIMRLMQFSQGLKILISPSESWVPWYILAVLATWYKQLLLLFLLLFCGTGA